MEQATNSVVGPVAVLRIGSPCTRTQRKPFLAGRYQHNDAAPFSKGETIKAGTQTHGELLVQDEVLLDKLRTLLKYQNPPVTDMQSASEGFQNLSQLVAAVEVSHNCGIPFEQVKTQMQTTERLRKTTDAAKPDAHR